MEVVRKYYYNPKSISENAYVLFRHCEIDSIKMNILKKWRFILKERAIIELKATNSKLNDFERLFGSRLKRMN